MPTAYEEAVHRLEQGVRHHEGKERQEKDEHRGTENTEDHREEHYFRIEAKAKKKTSLPSFLCLT
jgi:hypothetical protein